MLLPFLRKTLTRSRSAFSLALMPVPTCTRLRFVLFVSNRRVEGFRLNMEHLASKQASKYASRQAGKQGGKQGGKASREPSRQAGWQASMQTSRR